MNSAPAHATPGGRRLRRDLAALALWQSGLECCGVGGLPCFRPNRANLNSLVLDHRLHYTARMRARGTAGAFKGVCQDAASTPALASLSYADAMGLAATIPAYRAALGLAPVPADRPAHPPTTRPARRRPTTPNPSRSRNRSQYWTVASCCYRPTRANYFRQARQNTINHPKLPAPAIAQGRFSQTYVPSFRAFRREYKARKNAANPLRHKHFCGFLFQPFFPTRIIRT